MKVSSESLREQLQDLDAAHVPNAMNAAELAKSIHALRIRRRNSRRMAISVAVAGCAIACVAVFPPMRTTESTNNNVVANSSTAVDGNSPSRGYVQDTQEEILRLRYQSNQLAQVIADLDRVIQQQTEIDRRIVELERRERENSIRLKQSESLTIDVAYDIGF